MPCLILGSKADFLVAGAEPWVAPPRLDISLVFFFPSWGQEIEEIFQGIDIECLKT
jgi:hypothetical protein